MKGFLKSSTRKYYKYQYNNWVQPTLSGNGTFGGDSMAVSHSYGGQIYYSGGAAWSAFSPNSTRLWAYSDERRISITIYIYYPHPLKATNISFSIPGGAAESGPAVNIKLYGGNYKEQKILVKDIGSVGDGGSYNSPISNDSYYQYYTLYLESYGTAYNDRVDITNILIQGIYREAVEATASDYDFYIDESVLSAVVLDNKYKLLNED